MRIMHVGRKLDSELLGATAFEIEPGLPGLCHFHHGNEERALVLSGKLALRTPAGGAIAGDAPTAGRDAPFEAFFRRGDH